MTKEELRTQKINEGWSVPQVSQWQLVSADGLEPKVYDVNNVWNPEQERYVTATVYVKNEGAAQEEATGMNQFRVEFDEEVRTWLFQKEQNIASVFAIVTTQIYREDEVAIAIAYMEDGNGNVTTNRYVVKKRAGTFSFMPLV